MKIDQTVISKLREYCFPGSYGVMAITLDFESNNPSSNLGRTLLFLSWFYLCVIHVQPIL